MCVFHRRVFDRWRICVGQFRRIFAWVCLLWCGLRYIKKGLMKRLSNFIFQVAYIIVVFYSKAQSVVAASKASCLYVELAFIVKYFDV